MRAIRSILYAIVAFVVVSDCVFTVNQMQQALITRFGDPVRLLKEPGLYVKVPFIEDVAFFDKRVISVEMSALEVTLGDKRRVIVDAFGCYRISDPLKFFQSVHNESGVQKRLYPVVLGVLSSVFGKIELSSLLSDSRSDTVTRIRGEVSKAVKGFGLEVVDICIRKTNLPPQNSEAICKRMISEREREAKELRAKGVEISKIIRSTADKENAIELAKAAAKVQELIAEGELEANKIYTEAFSKDKEFFQFFQSLDAYKAAFSSKNAAFVLSPSGEFFDFMKHGLR